MRLSILGLFGALILYAESLRPGLLPLNDLSQIIFGGIALALGYDAGLIAGWVLKKFKISPKFSLDWRVRYLLYFAFIAVAAYFSQNRLQWQREQRAFLGLEEDTPSFLLVLAGSIIVAFLAIMAGLLIRKIAGFSALHTRKLSTKLIVYGAVWLVVAAIGYAVFSLSIFGIQIFLETKSKPAPMNLAPPVVALQSGGPGSLVLWQGLGPKGQEFAVRGYDNALSQKPIRLYAGINNEADLEKRVDLVMQEFERTNAFERKAVIMFTPSGTGWVNPVAVVAAEKALDGNIASLALQYSNNAAVLQYLVDKNIPGEASSLLFSKLRTRLDAVAKEKRPKLYVYGESLGSLGSQEIFTGKSVEEIAEQVDGALWVGSPSASQLWSSLSKDTNTRIVRFGTSANDFESISGQWGPSRVAFLYNVTDPVVRFSTRLAYQSPVWLKEPRAKGIDRHMQWRPIITMGHILFELFPGRRPPSGVGHTYDEKIPCAVVTVLQVENKTGLDCGN